MHLSKTEEQLMNHLWTLGEAYMKDLISRYEDPKPAVTTVATLLKRMYDKGYIDYKKEGRSRLYYAKVKKDDYVNGQFKGFMNNFFQDSSVQFASFFAKNTQMTKEELEELKAIIENEINSKS